MKGHRWRAWKALVLLSRMTPEKLQPRRDKTNERHMKILPQHFQALADSGRLAGSVTCLNLSSLNCSFFFFSYRGLQISFRASALSTCNWGLEICWNMLCSCLRETHTLQLETWRLWKIKTTPVSKIFFISFYFKERIKISNRIDQGAVSRKCLEAKKV